MGALAGMCPATPPRRRGEGAQHERKLLPGKPVRQIQGHELSRMAPVCLSRVDGMAGELHFYYHGETSSVNQASFHPHIFASP